MFKYDNFRKEIPQATLAQFFCVPSNDENLLGEKKKKNSNSD